METQVSVDKMKFLLNFKLSEKEPSELSGRLLDTHVWEDAFVSYQTGNDNSSHGS